jgi:Ca2+-transporting ATPase
MRTAPGSESGSCKTPWHSQTAEITLVQIDTTVHGLSSAEAERRLAADGPNVLQEGQRISALALFLAQFKNLIIWILLGAGALSGLLGELVDMFAIFAIVLLNSVIGFYQEYKAEKSIAALKKMTGPQAKVRRDDRVQLVPATDIVVGDILELEAGDLIAADARLLQAATLKCVESALTGESEAVIKQPHSVLPLNAPLGNRENMLFVGTNVATGTGVAAVVATAMNTELGHIASLIKDAGSDKGTPLQQKLDAFGHLLVWVSLGIVALLFVLGWWRGSPLLELFMTAVSLAVAAVPEGLPAVVTVSLALGVMRMSRRRALVRKLPAVETLGSTTVICTDKTGTLTVGEMTVRALYVAGEVFDVTGEGYSPVGELLHHGAKVDANEAVPLQALAALLMGCNNSHLVYQDSVWTVIGDPTEGAMLAAAGKLGGDFAEIERLLPKQYEIPFDSDRKRRCVIRRMQNGQLRAMINGAPDVLLQRCTQLYTDSGIRPLTDLDCQQIIDQNVAMAGRGLRVLGSAFRDFGPQLPVDLDADTVESELVFVGMSGMYDPPRGEVKDAVAKCQAAGIRVVMITGDHPHTALAIARDLGIATAADVAMAGVELDLLSDGDLQQRAPSVAVYARVTAAHKLRIVRAWKANDAVVAMTGDGVNDAPAIQGADIGIAMGRSGTEVTKQSSDMIITDDNFTSIVAAVEEGRGIYDNIRKTLQYLLAGNTGELLLMTLCVLMALPVPLLPIHLLWINLVTDGLPALCLATDPVDPDVMLRKPRLRNVQITDGGFLGKMFFTGFLTAGVAFAVYYYALQTQGEVVARTQAFATLVFAEMLRAFGARSDTRPVWRIPLRTNIILVMVVMVSFSLQVWSHHNTTLRLFLNTSYLSLRDCTMLLIVGAIPLLVLEGVKFWNSTGRRVGAKLPT